MLHEEIFKTTYCCTNTSVTTLGDLLHFGQFLKHLATIKLPKSPTFLGNFCKGVKIYHFSCEIILGNFIRHLVISFWSHSTIPIDTVKSDT